jgi:hypothetical protein
VPQHSNAEHCVLTPRVTAVHSCPRPAHSLAGQPWLNGKQRDWREPATRSDQPRPTASGPAAKQVRAVFWNPKGPGGPGAHACTRRNSACTCNSSHATGTQACAHNKCRSGAALEKYKMHSILLLGPTSQMLSTLVSKQQANHTRRPVVQQTTRRPVCSCDAKGHLVCLQLSVSMPRDQVHFAHTQSIACSVVPWGAPATGEELTNSSGTAGEQLVEQSNYQAQPVMAAQVQTDNKHGMCHLLPQHIHNMAMI